MIQQNVGYFVLTMVYHYSTGVQIVSCTLTGDLALPESTGLPKQVLSMSVNEISFDKKSVNQITFF